MAYNLKYNTGMIENPISFRDTNGLNVENIVSLMSQKAEELGVPARITTSTVKEGGLFGSTFLFFGESKANTATNKANARKNTLTGMIMNSIAGSNEMAYQQEMFWHRQIYEIFESLIQ